MKSRDFAVLHPENIAAGNIDFPARSQNRPIGRHEGALVRPPDGKLYHHPIVHSINAEDFPVDVRECLRHAAGDQGDVRPAEIHLGRNITSIPLIGETGQECIDIEG